MSFKMSKIHQIIDIIGQFVAPNRRTIQEKKQVLPLTCIMHCFFQKSVQDLTSFLCTLRTRDLPTLEVSLAPRNYVLKEYETKLFFYRNIRLKQI